MTRSTGVPRIGRTPTFGQLVVLEGQDDVGKTKLAGALLRSLREEGIDCASFSFPGQKRGTLSAHIYRLYHQPFRYNVRELNARAVQLLLTAAHIEVIESLVLPALRSGKVVILDRFWWSTWVYARASGVPGHFIQRLLTLERLCWENVEPSVVFWINRRLISDRNPGDPLSLLYARLVRRETRRRPGHVRVFANDGTIRQAVSALRVTLTELGVR